MKSIACLVISIMIFGATMPLRSNASELANRLKGRILLQTESKGEAWYVNIKDGLRYYMADGLSAFEIMRKLGVGISNDNLGKVRSDEKLAKQYQGKIFLQAESRGEAYYVDTSGQAHYLKDGNTAYVLMCQLCLGIKNNDLEKIPKSEKDSQAKDTEFYKINKVVDGDTVEVYLAGQNRTLRLIGLDTPETVDPRKPVQCFGSEASARAKELLSGQKVRLESDTSQGELDKYGRLLRYIWLVDGTLYNKKMIADGYAHEYTYNIPYKYQADFKNAQKEAQNNLRGLWSPTLCNGDTKQSAATTSVTVRATSTIESPVGKYYTSSFAASKYYYPAACEGWRGLKQGFLKSFESLSDLLKTYPNRTLSPGCK